MCLILFAKDSHPDYKLIVAANRDEFYARETKPADFWDDNPNILAGRDMEAGGTWMGVNKSGYISMLTNFRDLQNIKQDAPSRGHLVSDFLSKQPEAKNYLLGVEQNGQAYNGFNIICGTADELHYYGNYQNGVHNVEKGVHGLSNALLNTSWPKVVKGRKKLDKVVSNKQIEVNQLFEALYDDVKAPKEKLPDTGVGLEKEEMLSPMFIKSPEYGSRCSTVLLVDRNNEMTFAERSYNIQDFSYSDKSFRFKIGFSN